MAMLCAFGIAIVFTFKSSRYGLGNIWYRGITMLAALGGAIRFSLTSLDGLRPILQPVVRVLVGIASLLGLWISRLLPE